MLHATVVCTYAYKFLDPFTLLAYLHKVEILQLGSGSLFDKRLALHVQSSSQLCQASYFHTYVTRADPDDLPSFADQCSFGSWSSDSNP